MESKLDKLKRDYEEIKKRYKLPDFQVMNQEFEIEKIDSTKTELLLREIRRKIESRCGNFLKMLEEFLNPQFASMASLTIIKSFNDKDRESIKRNYQNIVSLILKSGILESNYDEKGEAEFIKEAYKEWQGIKKELKDLLESSKKIWQKKVVEDKSGQNYFG